MSIHPSAIWVAAEHLRETVSSLRCEMQPAINENCKTFNDLDHGLLRIRMSPDMAAMFFGPLVDDFDIVRHYSDLTGRNIGIEIGGEVDSWELVRIPWEK